MMTEQAVPIEWVTKIEVAKRQLRAAIRFFFERRDPVIVHALAAAGHQILTDLGKASGSSSLLKGKGQSVQELRKLNYAANFFKHADKDPNGQINIGPLSDFTAEFLMDAVVLLQGIDGNIPIEARIYWTWFVTKHKELFRAAGGVTQGLIDLGMDPDDFEEVIGVLEFHDLKAAATDSAAKRDK